MDQLSVLKGMADESRMRILCLLSEGAMCVCEIEAILGLLQSNVSRHLNKLTTHGLLKYYKQNKFIYYELDQTGLEQRAPFVFQALETEKANNPTVIADLKKLSDYRSGVLSEDEGMKRLCWNGRNGVKSFVDVAE